MREFLGHAVSDFLTALGVIKGVDSGGNHLLISQTWQLLSGRNQTDFLSGTDRPLRYRVKVTNRVNLVIPEFDP